MKKGKQYLCIALTIMMLGTSFLTGCSGGSKGGNNTTPSQTSKTGANSGTQSGSGDTKAKERQHVKIMSLTFNGNPIPDDHVLVKALEDQTNYDIDFNWILDADYKDKISTMIAGGTLPEIVILKSLDSNTVLNCRAGAFWDLTDYLKDYENLSHINQTVLENSMIDGRAYGIPRTRTLMRHGIIYRKDWLDNLGLDIPTNLDEFEKVMEAFAKNDPDGNGKDDTYGMVSTKASTGFGTVAIWFGAPNGWGEDETGRLIPAHLTKEQLDSMNWLKKLYDNGILNRDFVTLVNSGTKDAFKAQQLGVYFSEADEANAFNQYFTSQNINAELAVTPVFETPAGKVASPSDGFSGILAISKEAAKTEEDLRRCLEFLDMLNGEYAANLLTYGLEGTDFEKNADGTIVRNKDGNVSLGDYDGFNQIMMNVVDENVYKTVPSNEVEAAVLAAQAENLKYLLSNPGKALLRTSETYNSMGAQLDQLVSDARIQYIVGEIDEAGWNQVLETWKQQGGNAVIEEVNANYKK